MSSTFAASRNHLILGLCLPLAVLLGFLLAEPLESSSLAIVVMVLTILMVPLMMRWHHPLLIVSWNAAITPFFFPGRPAIWVLMAFISFFWGVLNRSVNPANRFLNEPSITKSLVFLLLVVLATAATTGGIGFRVFGSEETYGGRGYFYLLAATVGYFALTSRPIPRNRAQLYSAFFFLSGLTAIISNLAYLAGPSFYFLYDLFPAELAYDQAFADVTLGTTIARISGVTLAAPALFNWVLARHGIRGLFDLSRPGRMAVFLAATFASLFGGYRSTFALMGLTFCFLFVVEGLWRTRFLWIILLSGVVVAGAFLPFVNKMPLSVQRTLSILPIEVDFSARQSAQVSTEWRLEMWRRVLPEVPKHLLKGRGYALNPQAVQLLPQTKSQGFDDSGDWAAFCGDYHNGPLSVVMPFGIYGVVAFAWFLSAGVRVLYRNHRYGDPELQRINSFLLASFIAHIVFFVCVFGALSSDLYRFTGLLGLSVALNGGLRERAEANQMCEA